MSEPVSKGAEAPARHSPPTTVGHLSVHFEELHPQDVPFLFEESARKRAPGATLGAIGLHAVALIVIIVGMSYRPTYVTPEVTKNEVPKGIVWLAEPGPGGGGGGGGNGMKLPPRKIDTLPPIERPKPVALPVPQPVKKLDLTPDTPQLNIPAKVLADAATAVGTLDGIPGSPSAGPGSGGGAGSGTGGGIGPGNGNGLGPGWGGGFGGGAYRPGSGISNPTIVREVRPQYTADAMRAKIQGVVIVECVVNANGTVGDAQVVKSLDPTFGLDQEAIKAAKQWLFKPGTRNGVPVPVVVSIELSFNLR